MSNALEVSGENDGHVFRKQARSGGMAIGAWPSLENSGRVQHDQRTNNRQTRIRQPAGVARA
jgi:hypothetical protein